MLSGKETPSRIVLSLEIATVAAEALRRNVVPWMSPTRESNNNSKFLSSTQNQEMNERGITVAVIEEK